MITRDGTDTLELANQAVSIPSASWTPGLVSGTSGTGAGVVLATITFNSTGAQVAMNGSATVQYPSGASTLYMSINRTAPSFFTVAESRISRAFGSTAQTLQMSVGMAVDTPGAGSCTYQLVAGCYDGISGTYTTAATNRSLFTIEVKK